MSFRARPHSEKDLIREILARLDDLERGEVQPVQRIGDRIYWVDPITGDQILLAPECPCDDDPEPEPSLFGDIWMSTSLSEGDTTWVSNNGASRTLASGAVTGDSGIVVRPTSGFFYFLDPSDIFGDLTLATFTLTIDLSTWWTFPSDISEAEQVSGSGNAVLQLFPQSIWDGVSGNPNPPPSPPNYSMGQDEEPDFPNDPVFASASLDPASIGITGWRRATVRLQQDCSTGDCEIWAGPNASSLTSFGTVSLVLPAGSPPTSQGFWSGLTGSSFGAGGYRDDSNMVIIHGVTFESDVDGLLCEFDQSDVDADTRTYEVGVKKFEHFQMPGGWRVGSGTTATPSSSSPTYIAVAPGGAPVWCRQTGSGAGPIVDVWASAGTLSDPLVAYSTTTNPATIQIAAVDPADLSSLVDGSHQGVWIWAVVDRATWDAADLDVNDWPDGWWPFGSRTAN